MVFSVDWFRAILPKSALRVEEEAWNAYPYTKTIFRCPFIEKFSITIETVYKPDGGTQENVFGLGQRELKTRLVGKRGGVGKKGGLKSSVLHSHDI